MGAGGRETALGARAVPPLPRALRAVRSRTARRPFVVPPRSSPVRAPSVLAAPAPRRRRRSSTVAPPNLGGDVVAPTALFSRIICHPWQEKSGHPWPQAVARTALFYLNFRHPWRVAPPSLAALSLYQRLFILAAAGARRCARRKLALLKHAPCSPAVPLRPVWAFAHSPGSSVASVASARFSARLAAMLRLRRGALFNSVLRLIHT